VAGHRLPGLAKTPTLRHTEPVPDPSSFDDTEMTPEEFRSRLARAIPTDLVHCQFVTETTNTGTGTRSEVLPAPAIGQLAHWGQELAGLR